MDIDKQVAYWRASAEEDWDVGRSLVVQGKTRHGLFFLHLALEKALKAHVCRAAKEFAPRIHSLRRLSVLSGLPFAEANANFLAEFDRYDIAGRYPDTLGPLPTRTEAESRLAKAQEIFTWLTRQL